jgi:small-conductance mechanosensitive channel|tara:strand:- start:2000 stop:2851 length:852 start_codon:yes stop_codon:yes gene_type:complete
MAVMDKIEYWLNVPIVQIGDYALRTADLASAIGILLITMLVSRIITRAATMAAKRSRARDQNIYVINRMLKYIVYAVGILTALSTLGFGFGKLAIVAGALGVGIGFGLQSIVNNFVSGIIILFEKSLRVGDFIELPNGLLGEVREINIRSTLIRTLDNADILVPNADFITNQVNNWTLNDDVRRFSIPFSVAYGSDLELVTKAGLAAADKVELTLHRSNLKPVVLIHELGASGVECLLSVWTEGALVKRPGLVKSTYLTAIYNSLRDHGLEIPFPQMDVHMRQ